MRIVKHPQRQLGEVDISKIEFDPKSRDELPQLLMGLQYIYTNIPIREEVFNILETDIAPKVSKENGRPGMDLWKVLVLGAVRLNLNLDYDRLHNEANNHAELREMLGHNCFDRGRYGLQTLKDNLRLLTPEILDKINQVIVKAGHQLLKKKEVEVLKCRTDSFVVETNVHYPTDINLLLDAMRKVITLTSRVSEKYGLSDWRQAKYNLRHVKKLMRCAQNKKRSSAKTEEQKLKKNKLIVSAHKDYIEVAKEYIVKAGITLEKLVKQGSIENSDFAIIESIKNTWFNHALRQIDQIERRVILGEVIAHKDKVFSLFQPHTEWIVKGKAGVPMEMGLKVAIVEDQNQFILHHQVMEHKTDDEIAVEITKEALSRFPNIKSNSYDKGFHSPKNQEELREILETLVLPRKGKLSVAAKELENTKEFLKERRQHSAVESAINALEVHGLDICLDHGIDGFKKYVALAIVSRNLQRIGAILKNQNQVQKRRRMDRRDILDDALKHAA